MAYLRKIREYRQNGSLFSLFSLFTWTNPTYIQLIQNKLMVWSNRSTKGLKQLVSKGNRVIVVHAGNEDGFVKDALLTFMTI